MRRVSGDEVGSAPEECIVSAPTLTLRRCTPCRKYTDHEVTEVPFLRTEQCTSCGHVTEMRSVNGDAE